MATEVRHHEHIYTFQHPIGWSGGDRHVCDKLNEFRPASDYPAEEAEEIAVRHALAGILAGGEVISPRAEKHIQRGADLSDVGGSSNARDPNRILDVTEEAAHSGATGSDPSRILDDTEEDDRSGMSGTDPDRILEG